jgi:hypothetical protein
MPNQDEMVRMSTRVVTVQLIRVKIPSLIQVCKCNFIWWSLWVTELKEKHVTAKFAQKALIVKTWQKDKFDNVKRTWQTEKTWRLGKLVCCNVVTSVRPSSYCLYWPNCKDRISWGDLSNCSGFCLVSD